MRPGLTPRWRLRAPRYRHGRGTPGRVRAGRRTPFGYRTADGEAELTKGDHRPLVENAEEQKQLAAIRGARKRGLGARRIATSIYRRFKTNPRTGKAWSPELVASLLQRQGHRPTPRGVAHQRRLVLVPLARGSDCLVTASEVNDCALPFGLAPQMRGPRS